MLNPVVFSVIAVPIIGATFAFIYAKWRPELSMLFGALACFGFSTAFVVLDQQDRLIRLGGQQIAPGWSGPDWFVFVTPGVVGMLLLVGSLVAFLKKEAASAPST